MVISINIKTISSASPKEGMMWNLMINIWLNYLAYSLKIGE